MIPLVILCGQSKSGKDTVGKYLCEKYGAISMALADPLKVCVQQMFPGITDEMLWGGSENRNQVISDTIRPVESYGIDFEISVSKIVCSEGVKSDILMYTRWWLNSIKEQPYTIRKILQTFGTEVVRKVDPNIWVDLAIQRALRLINGGYKYDRKRGLIEEKGYIPKAVVITDGRFLNEINAVRLSGGMAIKIERPQNDSTTPQAGVKNHESELQVGGIPEHFFDIKIWNNLSEALLLQKADSLATRYLHLDSPSVVL